MVSVASIVSRVCAGGRVATYMKAVALYFAVSAVSGGGGGGGGGSALLEMAVKCAPILCLVAAVALQRERAEGAEARYRRRVALGLALSAAGDALLVWPHEEHMLAGMAAFAAAHCAYVAALGWRPLVAWAAPPLYGAALAYCWAVLRPRGVMRVSAPAYSLLLATMTWRAVARGGLAAAGGAVFLVSDALLAYDMFAGPLPHRTALVMTTYYAAQLLLALSALARAPAEAPPPPRCRRAGTPPKHDTQNCR